MTLRGSFLAIDVKAVERVDHSVGPLAEGVEAVDTDQALADTFA